MPSKDIYVNPIELGLNDLSEDQWEDSFQQQILERLTAYVDVAKPGDTISLQKRDDKYRNEWTYLWDGEKAIELDYSIDEYGALPHTFKVTDTEFSPDWWTDTIAHNSIFWLSDKIKKQMVFKKEDGQIFADFLIGSIMWRCYVDAPEEVESIDSLATREDIYFQMCESECCISSSPDKPYVMYMYFK